MKLFYKKDYEKAVSEIENLKLKINGLKKKIEELNLTNDNLTRENNNLITKNKLLLSDNEKSIDEIKSLNFKVIELEEQSKNSYKLKIVRPGRPVKPQTMKIKSSVTSRSPVRNYMKEEFNYEES